jgi:glycosyltransferase involved in cell wall biosynthesis
VQEGFGLVFAEAMAAGLPVVACRAAAVPELVHDGETGLLVPPRTPAALAAALERMLGDDRLRKEMGMAGRARVETLDLVPVARRFLEAVS